MRSQREDVKRATGWAGRLSRARVDPPDLLLERGAAGGSRPRSRTGMRRLVLALFGVCTLLARAQLRAADVSTVDEELLCRRLGSAYSNATSVKKEQFAGAYERYVEQISYLIVVAGRYSRGSGCLNALFGRIQRESPSLAAPHYVMTSDEVEALIGKMARDGADDAVFQGFRKSGRYVSELIRRAQTDITRRSGFRFDFVSPPTHVQ